MNKYFNQRHSSVLVLVIILTSVALMAAGGALLLLSNEYRMAHRSLVWNSTLFVAEAGVEQAWNEANTAQTNSGNAWVGWTSTATNKSITRSITHVGNNTPFGTYSVNVVPFCPPLELIIQLLPLVLYMYHMEILPIL